MITLESLLERITNNQNPEYRDGLKIMSLYEHTICLILIFLISTFFGFIVNIVTNFQLRGFVTESLGIAIAIFIFSGLSFTLMLLPICFFKIRNKKIVNSVMIYEIWIIMSIIFSFILLIVRLNII